MESFSSRIRLYKRISQKSFLHYRDTFNNHYPPLQHQQTNRRRAQTAQQHQQERPEPEAFFCPFRCRFPQQCVRVRLRKLLGQLGHAGLEIEHRTFKIQTVRTVHFDDFFLYAFYHSHSSCGSRCMPVLPNDFTGSMCTL